MTPRTGFHQLAGAMGLKAAERDIVGRKRINQTGDRDFYLPTNPSEYIPLRDEALTNKYGKGFLDMYKRYKPIGVGAFGAVFEKPDDLYKSFKSNKRRYKKKT